MYPTALQLFIGGEWINRSGHDLLNPADETVLAEVPHATRSDLEAAVVAAEQGFKIWSTTAPARREEIILKATALMRERIDEIAVTMTLEQGKPLGEARTEILRACEIIEWDAQEGRRAYGRVIPAAPNMRHTALRRPVGPVAAFAPWNFPVSSPARKVGGALAAGCSIILKASEETPGGAVELTRAFNDAGLPAGVLNLIFGEPPEISEFLIPHPSIRLITFTGSIPVGKHLASMAGQFMKPAIMELGGHSPVIVCEDVDPIAAAKLSVIGKSRNAGQVCVSPTRWLVDERRFDDFVGAFAEHAAMVRVGNGLDPSTQMGPLANDRRIDAMEAFVADARAKGAEILTGGARHGDVGYFYPLTVIANAPDDARVMQEEPFGPLALINPVKSLGEAIEKANALTYGLAGYAFTNSARNVAQLSDYLEVGNLAINHFAASSAETPFGGVKESGYGREGGTEGLTHYMVVRNVSLLVD